MGDSFCAGADLKAVVSQDSLRMNRLAPDGDGPMEKHGMLPRSWLNKFPNFHRPVCVVIV